MIPTGRPSKKLLQLAATAGISTNWRDVHGDTHQVQDSVLRHMLDLLHLPCNTPSQIDHSLRELNEGALLRNGLVIAQQGEPIVVHQEGAPSYEVVFEDGQRCGGVARSVDHGQVSIAPINLLGYHRLNMGDRSLCLAVCPKRGPSVSALTGRDPARAWGLAVQVGSVYHSGHGAEQPSLRDSARASMCIWPGWATGGDYGALADLAGRAAHHRASALAISPVHAMFSADPQRYSPYSPSSRLFLNVAYIDPTAVLGEAAVRAALSALEPTSEYEDLSRLRVDWPKVLSLRLKLLRRLFTGFYQHRPAGLFDEFTQFRQRGGQALEDHARYEALHEDPTITASPQSGWQDWPSLLRDPAGAAIDDYARRHPIQVSFHVFLQWLADQGMRHAQHSARSAGMSIGLVTDMAVGADPRGSHTWSRQKEILSGATIGAPPDMYQPDGQNWGLAAFSPHALHQKGYAPFIDILRASLAHAGAVRIDHILGMARMWLIPEGASSTDGAYVRYPLDDMLSLAVLEAWRHDALLIGENLGTVPEGFNRQIEDKGILGTSVLWFERDTEMDDGSVSQFKRRSQWHPAAIAMSSTHDLPTLNGWWSERDLQWRRRLGLSPGDQTVRHHDKTALWHALCLAGCVSPEQLRPWGLAPRDAILAFVAGTPAPLVLIPMEDLLGLFDQPNMPGTGNDTEPHHPNWIQSLPMSVENIFSDQAVRRSIAAIIRARRAA